MNQRVIAVGGNLLGCMAVVTLLCSCRDERSPAQTDVRLLRLLEGSPEIRVAIVGQAQEFTIQVEGPVSLTALGDGAELMAKPSLAAVKVRTAADGIRIGDWTAQRPAIRIAPQKDASLRVNGVRYRGLLEVYRSPRGLLTGVNSLDLESYLCAVLGSEMPLSWSAEALKAQAVAARSYALYRMKTRADELHHVVATVQDQRYCGLVNENARAREIVELTEGIVLLSSSKIFPAYYHATCGGHTEDARLVFGEEQAKPLSGARCGFCGASKYYRWSVSISEKTIVTALADRRPGLRTLAAITPFQKGKSGRAQFVEIAPGNGERFRLPATELRSRLGVDKLRSTAFSAVRDGPRWRFTGAGWGHGVGLCQWGAGGMASRGADYQEILRHYYPGAQLVKVY